MIFMSRYHDWNEIAEEKEHKKEYKEEGF